MVSRIPDTVSSDTPATMKRIRTYNPDPNSAPAPAPAARVRFADAAVPVLAPPLDSRRLAKIGRADRTHARVAPLAYGSTEPA